MTRIRMGLALGLLPALALALAACGGSDKPSGVASLGGTDKATSTTRAGGGDNRQAALNWARCMRQHGINIPDPKPGGGIDANGAAGVNPNSPKYKAAEQACEQLPNGNKKQTQSNGGGA